MNDETKEDEEGLTDWNFIVTSDGDRVYDLMTGILYRLVYDEDEPGVDIRYPGSRPITLYTGDEALSFWKQLTARIGFERWGVPG